MFVLVIIIVTLFIGTGIFLMLHKKKSCTCIGKSCDSDDGCGNKCCDNSKNQKCVNGKCCSTDCSGKTCSDKNGCGELCSKYLCGESQKCYKDNCCSPQCTKGSCGTDGCGGTCPCENGEKCFKGQCCKPPDCSTGVCGEEQCGVKCECNNRYCTPNSCCQEGKCNYTDLCKTQNLTTEFLYKTWGRFCQPLKGKEYITECRDCEYVDAQFDGESLAPISGTIKCKACIKNDGTWGTETSIDIDPNVVYYYNNNGKLSMGPISKDYCKNSEGGCNNCLCMVDDDCKRFGCSKCVDSQCE